MIRSRPAIDEVNRLLRPFWQDGRMVSWPARDGRRRLVLAEVVRAFPPAKRMSEVEVDAILREIWSDYCQLRRALIDRARRPTRAAL